MSVQHIRSPAGMGKIAIIVLGIVVLSVGLDSHFNSAWTEYNMHKYCVDNPITGIKCPSFSLEQYFVAMIIICFVLSLASLIASILLDTNTGVMKLSDAGYHGVAALLLFIAAIVYIFSAEKIHDIVGGGNRIIKFKRGEKLAAGALTIIHALLYGIVGFLIFRS